MQETYIRGITARGRRQAVAPRYPPKVWNLYLAVIDAEAKCNNNMEGWHNRLQNLIGRHHPTFYRFLTELQDEQAKTDYDLRALEMGQTLPCRVSTSQKTTDERIFNVVSKFNEYYDTDRILRYLEILGYYFTL